MFLHRRGIHVACELISFYSSSQLLPSSLFFHMCVVFSFVRVFFYDKNINHNNGTKVELVHAKTKIQRFYASKNSSLGLFMFSLLELVSQCCFLPLPLRFHHSADYCHQRKANRLHPDVRIQSSRCRVDTWQKILTRVTPNQRSPRLCHCFCLRGSADPKIWRGLQLV